MILLFLLEPEFMNDFCNEYHNRRIRDFLNELQLTEGRATGFPKIYDAMNKNGSPVRRRC